MKNPVGFSTRQEKVCVRLKFLGISGRRTDLLYCFFFQCAHWEKKHVPGAQVAGNELKAPRGLSAV